jgi:RNA polymerase sigma-70 factor, ECF subfamily
MLFDEVYEAQYPHVWSFLLHATGRVDLAVELTSRTFFRALRSWPRFQPTGAPVSAWLIRIALNEWRRELRRRKFSRFVPLLYSQDDENAVAQLPENEVTSAAEMLEQDETFQYLHKAISALPEKYASPLILYYFEHLNLNDVAVVLGRPVGTVKSLIHRGIARLRADQGLRESLGVSFSEANS